MQNYYYFKSQWQIHRRPAIGKEGRKLFSGMQTCRRTTHFKADLSRLQLLAQYGYLSTQTVSSDFSALAAKPCTMWRNFPVWRQYAAEHQQRSAVAWTVKGQEDGKQHQNDTDIFRMSKIAENMEVLFDTDENELKTM